MVYGRKSPDFNAAARQVRIAGIMTDFVERYAASPVAAEWKSGRGAQSDLWITEVMPEYAEDFLRSLLERGITVQGLPGAGGGVRFGVDKNEPRIRDIAEYQRRCR